MRINLIRSLPLILLMSAELASSAQAQTGPDGFPSMGYFELADCNHMRGLMLMEYDRISDPRWNRFEISELCLDPSAPTLMASEPISGLTFVQNLGDGMHFQVVTAGSHDYQRTGLMVSPSIALADAQEHTLENAPAWSLHAQYFGSQPRRHPDAHDLRGTGYVFPTLQQNAADTAGPWLLHFEVNFRADMSGQNALNTWAGGVHVLAELTVDDTGPVGVHFLHDAQFMEHPVSDPGIGFAIEDGRIRTSLSFRMVNARLPVVRTPNEWATAAIEIPLMHGHVTRGVAGQQMRALGVGRALFADGSGRQESLNAIVSMTATPLSPGARAAGLLSGQ